MSNPDIALFLYLMVILSAVMLSPKWGEFWQAVTTAKEAKVPTTTDGSSATTEGKQE